ncbi:hypothetical protein EV702DRAFT_1198203 [Suillus placidus]|uniref:Uncharacterized protein n=1 Tax=Suillus placidus TaxID=48579 RepID=A0A9P7D1Y3_9AGAM|nr:hypothetical protein EV702DRAFT_1198203 [Suillus placidus]
MISQIRGKRGDREAAAVLGARALPINAVSCAIRRDNLRRAVEFVEQGRGQQWSLASRPRILKSRVRASAITGRATADSAARECGEFAEQWEVTEIRYLQGVTRFLLPPSYADSQEALCYGPIIILIASKYSCNAIIVPTSQYAQGLHQGDKAHILYEFRTDLKVFLRKIWDEVMISNWMGKCLEDIYICSYTPTLSALIRARQTITMKTSVIPSFPAIGQSQLGAGQSTVLATVDSELELIHKLALLQVKFISLSGDEATQAGALDALQRNTWVHLACNGRKDRK